MNTVIKFLYSIAKAAAVLAVLVAICFAFRGETKLRSNLPQGAIASVGQNNDSVSPDQYKPQVGSYGGEIYIGTLGEPKSFNPITSGEVSTSQYTQWMFLGLTTVDPWTYQIKPELALSWMPDETGLVWLVKLRKGVLWSDGEAFTADDVLFTYDLIYDKRYVCSTRSAISGPNGEKWQLRKIDDHTVEFTLFDKNAIFPLLLASEILPQHKYQDLADQGKFNEALGPNTLPEDIVGTGPFMLDKFEPSRQVILKRNPNFYRKDAAGNTLPYLDKLVYVICKNLDVMKLKFDQGQTDYYKLRGEDYPVMSPEEEEKNFTIYRLGPAGGSSFVFFNMNEGVVTETQKPLVAPHKLKWFRDVRFRRAVSHCIDRDFIVRSALNGLGYPQYGPMNRSGNYFYGHKDIPKFPYDLEKAKLLLDDMALIDRDGDGIREDSEGNKLEFSFFTNSENGVRQKIASLISQDMQAVGMSVNYRAINFNTLVGRLDTGAGWEGCLLALTGGPEPHWGANIWRSSGRLHMWYPAQESPSTDWEAEIDQIFAEGIKEIDLEKRRQIYYRWQEIVGQQQPLMYTATPETLRALRNRFGNVFPSLLGGVLHNLDEFYVIGEPQASEVAK